MTSPIDVAYVEIKPKTSTFGAETEASIIGALEAVDKQVDVVINQMEAQFRELTAHVDADFDVMRNQVNEDFDLMRVNAVADMDRIEAKGAETSLALGSAFSKAATYASIGVSFLGAGLTALTGFGLKSAANLEQVQIAFESLTGSVAKGKQQFLDLQKFAAATPFQFKDLTTAAQRFDAFSAAIGQSQDQLIPFLTTIGNLVSETGGGAEALNSISLALGQTASQGKITLGNLEQINNAIPGFSSVAALASVRGETTAQVMQEISAGSIDAKTGINQLLVGMQKFPGAAGAMDKQAQTLLGVFSTFKDTVSQALSNAFEPIIPGLKDALTQITPIIGDALKTLAPALGSVLTGVVKIAGPLIVALSSALTPILNALGPAIAKLGPAFAAIGGGFTDLAVAVAPFIPMIGQIITQLASNLGPVLDDLAIVVSEVGDAFTQLLPALLPTFGTFVNLLAVDLEPALVALSPLLLAVAQVLTDILNVLNPLLPVLVPITLIWGTWNILLAATTAILDANPFVLLAVAIGAVVVGIIELVTHWSAVVDALKKAWDWVKKYAGIIAIFAPFIGLPILIVKHWKSIAGFFEMIWDKIVGFFERLPGQVLSFLVNLPQNIGKLAMDAMNAFFFAIGYGIGLIIKEFMLLPGQIMFILSNMWKGIVALFTKVIPDLVRWVIRLHDDIMQWINRLWNDFVHAVAVGISKTISFFEKLPGQILTWIGKLPGLLQKAVADAGKWLYQAGRDVVMGLIHGIEDVVGDAIKAVKSAMHSIISGAKSALGISSPSKVFMAIGQQTVEGYAHGISGAAPIAQKPISDMLLPSGGGSSSGSGGGIIFSPGSIVVNVGGPLTNQQAGQIGQSIGMGILTRLATRNINNTVRAM